MDSAVVAAIFSTCAVALAEMGDKSQLLAMAFAARYKVGKVLAGILIATLVNHALAVVVGSLAAKIAPLQMWVQIITAVSFIFFGLWTIRGDSLEGEGEKTTRFGAVITVALVFFAAEMGDKTQLATMALAAKFPDSPAAVLAGTTAGMLLADAVGIVIGVVMCRNIPQKTVKIISAALFIVFGLIASWQVLVTEFGLDLRTVIIIIAVMAVLTAIAAYSLVKRTKPKDLWPQVLRWCRIRRK